MNYGTLIRNAVFALGVILAFIAAARPQEPPAARSLVIYLNDGAYIAAIVERDGGEYLSLVDLVRRLGLPYTDAVATQTFAIRAPAGVLTATAGSREVTADAGALELSWPVLKEENGWLAPVEFLTRGLSAVMGLEFQRGGGSPRMFAMSQPPAGLTMEAGQTGGITRLTLRAGAAINVRVQQSPEENRVILALDPAPLAPARESLDYRDGSVRSVGFDDADGRPKVVVETTPQVASVRLVPADQNRTFVVEFIPAVVEPAEAITAAPAPIGAPPPDARPALQSLRVIVIDPGHGGMNGGAQANGLLEKDVTLMLARRLRATLQERLRMTVILTRDADRDLTGDQRAAIANNSRGDLMISLHVGFSPDPTETGASIFLTRTPRPAPPAGTAGLFRPWYEAQAPHRERSRRFAAVLQEKLAEETPRWEFPIREAPLSLLTTATLPAVLLELGNANNPQNAADLANVEFQNRIIEAIVAAAAEFGGGDPEQAAAGR